MPDVKVDQLRAAAYTVPTETPESDGTLAWDETTIVVVEVTAGVECGLGYSYADRSAAGLADRVLGPLVAGSDPMAIEATWRAMVAAVRNVGRPGVASAAIAAVDTALWDLKARVLGLPLVDLLGAARAAVPVYGSGGFTSMTVAALEEQLGGWAAEDMGAVKLKVGRDPEADPARVGAARRAVGRDVELFVDANGGYARKQALALSEAFASEGVTWFEEPVSSDDLDGLRLLRDRAPAGMEVAAGEYGHDPAYFARMLAAGAVDVLQADATRCGGITGFAKVAALCEAAGLELSSHTAPSLHCAPCCALGPVRHLEWFADHVRIERRFFDGFLEPVDGALAPDRSRPGLGLALKRADAEPFLTWASAA